MKSPSSIRPSRAPVSNCCSAAPRWQMTANPGNHLPTGWKSGACLGSRRCNTCARKTHYPQKKLPPPSNLPKPAKKSDPHLQRGISILQSRLTETAASSQYKGNLPELSAALSRRYAAHFGWSASKLKSYGTCPFYFYIAYALELEPRIPPEEGYDVRMLGSMLHQILEFTYQQADDPTNLG